jgi:inosine/xanthosine triphosphatase
MPSEPIPRPIKVVVTSHNPVKRGAVETAFRNTFPGTPLQIESVAVPSGVSAQPMGDAETRQGARNRVLAGRQAQPDADYWVGLEGGLEEVDGELLASAWMVVGNRAGQLHEARTPTLPLPPRILELVRAGMELGEANDRVFGTHNSKQAQGAFGLLTGGRMTREGIYAQTLELALVPFSHPLWCD